MSAGKSAAAALLFLALLVSCAPATVPSADTPPPTEGAPPTATGAPAATKPPPVSTRPPPTIAPVVGRLHCPECAQEGKAIDLFDHGDCTEALPSLVVGQARHGDQVHVLVWRRHAYSCSRVRVVETGLVGWVQSVYLVVP